MKPNDQTEIRSQQPTLDSFIEDAFGLNIRGLKTLWHLIIAPKRVLESARVTDWRERYTPTLRLTFSVITVFMLLSFFGLQKMGPSIKPFWRNWNKRRRRVRTCRRQIRSWMLISPLTLFPIRSSTCWCMRCSAR